MRPESNVLQRIARSLERIADALEHRGQHLVGDASVLLEAVAAAVAGRLFSSRELVEHARLEAGAPLRLAIVDAIGSLNARHLGKYLKSIEGTHAGELVLRRHGTDQDGVVWSVAHRSYTLK